MRNSNLYTEWLEEHGIDGLDRPNAQGLFERLNLVCVLPWLRAYSLWTRCRHEQTAVRKYLTSIRQEERFAEHCQLCGDLIPKTIIPREDIDDPVNVPQAEPERPPWQPGTWNLIKRGWTRFLRADQVLDLIAEIHPPDGETNAEFLEAARKLLSAWLVPLGTVGPAEVLDHRIEAIRVKLHELEDGTRTWNWDRKAIRFPNAMRKPLKGMDPVHTLESERAGLVSYLCRDWSIDDDGSLRRDGNATEGAIDWGPSTHRIPYRLHNRPRRLMLGTSMHHRVVRLVESERPAVRVTEDGWEPPGRNLRVVYSALNGWTHEDGIVVSQSAAERLTSREQGEYRILIPAVSARTLIEEPGRIESGKPLVRCWIDLFALGYGRYDAEQLRAENGLLEVRLSRAVARHDEVIDKVKERTLRTSRWSKLVIVQTHRIVSLGIGDKLSTRHGIKGVVSRILPDAEMPETDDGPADIVLSPVGIARRGAMGQFRETRESADDPTECRQGRIFVSRQPQHARDRWSVRNGDSELRFVDQPGQPPATGQRYGEMEFWALMMHGADHIARELLSEKRAVTTRWMECESASGTPVQAYRRLATRALNRFLAVVGTSITGRRLVAPDRTDDRFVVGKRDDAFWILRSDPNDGNQLGTSIQDFQDRLNDDQYFQINGGLGAIELPEPVTLKLDAGGDLQVELEFEAVHVIPPWLRPHLPDGKANPITTAYVRLITALRWRPAGFGQRNIRGRIDRLVQTCMNDRFGAEAFLRRSVLGRRLTRSARAVIVPRPDLAIDQVGLPRHMVEQLFEGLADEQKRLVLVNRNPTLHRRGLLALQPVISDCDNPVIGLPPGILKSLNADFDGDQACVIALETEQALEQAEQLRPGHRSLQLDPFRTDQPAFPLLKELAHAERELKLANRDDLEQPEWCAEHQALLETQLREVGDGWDEAVTTEGLSTNAEYWALEGMPAKQKQWLEQAAEDMDIVYKSVRKKGQLGGVLRRNVYRRACTGTSQFYRTVEALGAVTEPLSQSALSCKTGEGAMSFSDGKYFKDPVANRDLLDLIDETFDKPAVEAALGDYCEPTGVLGWMARPNLKFLLQVLATGDPVAVPPAADPIRDPRLAWFLDPK